MDDEEPPVRPARAGTARGGVRPPPPEAPKGPAPCMPTAPVSGLACARMAPMAGNVQAAHAAPLLHVAPVAMAAAAPRRVGCGLGEVMARPGSAPARPQCGALAPLPGGDYGSHPASIPLRARAPWPACTTCARRCLHACTPCARHCRRALRAPPPARDRRRMKRHHSVSSQRLFSRLPQVHVPRSRAPAAPSRSRPPRCMALSRHSQYRAESRFALTSLRIAGPFAPRRAPPVAVCANCLLAVVAPRLVTLLVAPQPAAAAVGISAPRITTGWHARSR